MSLLVFGVLVLLVFGYLLYGRWVAAHFRHSSLASTPAHDQNDAVDFIPTKPLYLFGQHFSAIAAAGPIAGPIAACLLWGWVPSLLWILLGVVFIGAVHDYMTLLMSVRSRAQSIAQTARELLGTGPGRAFTAFIYIALLYIIVAFTDVTIGSFVTRPDELANLSTRFHPGGAVAAAGTLYLLLSMLMGLVSRYLSPPMWVLTLIFVPATFGVVWAGTFLGSYFVFSNHFWIVALGLYCLLASLSPAWLLLQPRGYLGGFVLYASIAVGLYGIFFGDFSIQQPAFKGFWSSGSSSMALLPFLFVTIACGACSGFHGLVCSGTTSKQIDKEKHVHPIGYGAMLSEAVVAVIALAMVMMMSPEATQGLRPGTIYGQGLGQSLALIVGQEHLAFCITFGAMAFSTFVFDTLDVSVRLGRHLISELFWNRNQKAHALGWTASLFTVLIPSVILFWTDAGSWQKFWTLFGSANQSLAALSLLLVWLWLRKRSLPRAFVLWPSFFVLGITTTSLLWSLVGSLQAWGTAVSFTSITQVVAQVLLLGLGLQVVMAIYKESKSSSDSNSKTDHVGPR